MSTVTAFDTVDVRFETSALLDGSDAMNPDPDYSAAYLRLSTDAADGHEGHAFVFTIGRLRSHMHQYRIYFKHGVVDETSGEHEAVLEALRSGKPASAEKAMLDHITKSYARISASLAEAEKAG